MSDIDRLATQKQLALFLVGSSEAYENYKRTQELQSVYPNDFDYYNDTFYYRHDRNIEEIKKIKTLLAKGVLKPEMLLVQHMERFLSVVCAGTSFWGFSKHFTIVRQEFIASRDYLQGEKFVVYWNVCQKSH
jgi:hypothetical protein